MLVPLRRPWAPAVAALVAGLGLGCAGLMQTPPPAPAPERPAVAAEDLTATLAPIRDRHGVPALGAALVRGGEVVAIGAVGVRRDGHDEPVTVDDRWHIGSDTKAMTATLYALDVDAGRATWDDTVGAVLAHLDPDPAWSGVTAWQLATHTAGVDSNPGGPWMLRLLATEAPPREARETLLRSVLASPPSTPPGAAFAYSNLGYIVLGAMIEARGDQPFEQRLVRDLLRPLGAVDVGFGAPGPGSPWGHRGEPGAWQPVEPSRFGDNPPAFGPAGGLHTTLTSWAAFVAAHVAGARGAGPLLPPDAWRRLHEPALDGYAAGWGVKTVDGERRLSHAGSNTMWYARALLLPDADGAVLVTCNAMDDAAEAAVGEAVDALTARLRPPPP